MKTTFVIRFGRPERIQQKKHVREIGFPFTVTDAVFVGTPNERNHSSERKIYVAVTDLLEKSCGLSEEALVKVLFEYARRHIEQKLRAGSLSMREEFTLGCEDVPQWPPFDYTRIRDPNGARVLINIDSSSEQHD
jgi:hypothetical protein